MPILPLKWAGFAQRSLVFRRSWCVSRDGLVGADMRCGYGAALNICGKDICLAGNTRAGPALFRMLAHRRCHSLDVFGFEASPLLVVWRKGHEATRGRLGWLLGEACLKNRIWPIEPLWEAMGLAMGFDGKGADLRWRPTRSHRGPLLVGPFPPPNAALWWGLYIESRNLG